MSLPQTSLDMAKAQHRRSTISTIPSKSLTDGAELSDIGASVGFRLAVMHPERVTAMIVQNGGAHVEAINKEFLTGGLSDYWEERSEKNAQVLLDWLLTIEGTKWHYLHGASDPAKRSPDNW